MYKQASYTKYQKKVIKFLSDTLGVDRPYSYERAQNNHLKVLIEGVSRPLYTGSTPSDTKAINNFMAEVKREVTQSSQPKDDESSISSPKLVATSSIQHSLDKIIQNCLKSLRTRTDTMKLKEEELILASDSLEGLKEYRLNEIKNAITLAKQGQKATVYLKPKEIRTLELKILEHVDFWMPNLAYYASLLGSKKEATAKLVNDGANNDTNERSSMDEKLCEVKVEETAKAELKPASLVLKTKKANKINIKSDRNKQDAARELMNMSPSNRISLLRKLSRAESLQLIEEVNLALTKNREEDILDVVKLIKEKGLQIDDIIPRFKPV